MIEFEWDADKATINVNKHGVAFEEAVTVFDDSVAEIISDEEHSDDEVREIIVGYSESHRLLVVCYTDRDELIRIISAREATSHERRNHEDPFQGFRP